MTTRRIILLVGIISLIVFFLRVALIINALIIINEESEYGEQLFGQPWEKYLDRYSFSEDLRRQLTLLQMESVFNLLFFLIVGSGCVFIYFKTQGSKLGSLAEREVAEPSSPRREIVVDRRRIRNIVLIGIPFGIAIFVLSIFISLTLDASSMPYYPDFTFLLNAFYMLIAILVVSYLLLVYNVITKKREPTESSSGRAKNGVIILSTFAFLAIFLWQFLPKILSNQTSANLYMDAISPMALALAVSCIVGITAYVITKLASR